MMTKNPPSVKNIHRFKDDINFQNYFKIDRLNVLNGMWSASRSIYPVIGCHAGTDGSVFPSEKPSRFYPG